MTEKISNAKRVDLHCSAAVKELTISWPALSQSQRRNFFSFLINCFIVNCVSLQEKMLQMLNKKVEEVYRNCIGDNEANIR